MPIWEAFRVFCAFILQEPFPQECVPKVQHASRRTIFSELGSSPDCSFNLPGQQGLVSGWGQGKLTHRNKSAAFIVLCGGTLILQDAESLVQSHRCLLQGGGTSKMDWYT
jgi:hypothetical protein